jgi:transcriptional regulator with XRE-family HTH domain
MPSHPIVQPAERDSPAASPAAEETLLPVSEIVESVAINVRRIRQARGLSQSEVARLAGVAKSTLSQLEVGQGNPTIETLFALAKVYGVPLGSLVQHTAVTLDVSRHSGRPTIVGAAVDMSLTATYTAGPVLYETYLMHVRQARQEADPHALGVEERILVTEGRLLTGPISAPVELSAGDQVFFSADRPHLYEGLTNQVTAALIMAYPVMSET